MTVPFLPLNLVRVPPPMTPSDAGSVSCHAAPTLAPAQGPAPPAGLRARHTARADMVLLPARGFFSFQKDQETGIVPCWS
ncbi:hypothetical protein CFAM422_003279 [Trichoderma lentiforme]|uniref:Uncharacterized protein n=1 Tax=Trichoderma lentiforme TaxID=1567552 RepID=A0A9P5CED9_9HYPO|nr:hypothetical protein CFAM422_003279 [Trichoderma lentiforme]